MMAGPIFSMTGFAAMEGDGVSLTIKGVNHRFLDLSLRLPPGCDAVEAAIRRMVKEHMRRGHVDVTVQVTRRDVGTGLEVNRELLLGHLAAFRAAAAVCGVGAEPDVNALLRVPGMLRAPALEDVDVGGAILALLPELLARFDAARALEGEALAAELRAGMGRLAVLTVKARSLCVGMRGVLVERLRMRLAEVLALSAAIPEERILAEAALLADRGDVEEELVRLETHTARFVAMLDEGGELGKRLDFLLQELNREANTLLSKTTGAAGLRLTELGLAMKVEIERAKEQVQNLE